MMKVLIICSFLRLSIRFAGGAFLPCLLKTEQGPNFPVCSYKDPSSVAEDSTLITELPAEVPTSSWQQRYRNQRANR